MAGVSRAQGGMSSSAPGIALRAGILPAHPEDALKRPKSLLQPDSRTPHPAFPSIRARGWGDLGGFASRGCIHAENPGWDPGRARAAARGGGAAGLGPAGLLRGMFQPRSVAGNPWRASPGHSRGLEQQEFSHAAPTSTELSFCSSVNLGNQSPPTPSWRKTRMQSAGSRAGCI